MNLPVPAMNTHHIASPISTKILTVGLFTHPLRLITHPFTRWGGSFLTIYTQASVPGRYHWSCSENKRKSWWWTRQIIKRIVFVFHCSTSAGRHFQMHPFQSPLHFCQVKIKNHLNGFLRGYNHQWHLLQMEILNWLQQLGHYIRTPAILFVYGMFAKPIHEKRVLRARSIEHEASKAKTYGIREHKVGGDDSRLASSYTQRAAA